MSQPTTVILRARDADRVVAGHPWIYEGGIRGITGSPNDGETVQVLDHRQALLGVGFFNSKSKIRVRMVTWGKAVIDQAFFVTRIRQALEHRRRHLPEATSFRVVNAEGDLLSGLIIDKYEDTLVMQISSLGMDERKAMVISALQEIFAPREIIERNDQAFRRFEGLPENATLTKKLLPAPVEIRMNGLRFQADLQAGHKTGLYLDQQENYARVAELVSRMSAQRVLDCFTFVGGFAVHCAQAGARKVHGLDQSEDAVRQARRIAELNGFQSSCEFEVANVFDWLKAKTQRSRKPDPENLYDVVILDPPSFTRTRSAVPQALRGYKEIHLRALKLLRPGGMLVTFCCSHHVNAGLFQDTILSAAFDARRQLRRLATFSQGPDHPILPAVAETEYLKGFAFEVIR